MKFGSIIVLVALGVGACGHHPKRTRYIIDSGVTGWVKISYKQPGSPELPVEDGFAVVHLSQDRRFVTRSVMNESWDGSEFYYQTPDGKRVPISSKDDAQRIVWGLEKTSDAEGGREVFFVGKQDQFDHIFKSSGGMGLMTPKPPEPPSRSDVSPDVMKDVTGLPK